MDFEEHAAKPLLAKAGIPIPSGRVAHSDLEAEAIARELGSVVVKALVPTGKRGKAGGIILADSPQEARAAAQKILGMTIADQVVKKVLVEQQVPIRQELYAAVLNDSTLKCPVLLFSAQGGMDIEEIADAHPDQLMRYPCDIRKPLDPSDLEKALPDLEGVNRAAIVDILQRLYDVYRTNDAELIEINPLALTTAGDFVALDCKFTLDESAIKRQAELSRLGTPDKLSDLEQRAQELNLKYIEFDGSVGIIANGAGLTMTSMDAVRHFGGTPANFMEIGGEAYTLGREALEIVLANPHVKSLLVNFCGAFARCDVMASGIVEGWAALKPDIPVFFTIHGTGDAEAIALVRDKLNIVPFEKMDDAVKAAVEAAK